MASEQRLRLFLDTLSQVPSLARVALLHVLRLSQQSKYLDLRTELVVAALRSFVNSPRPLSITATQALLGRDPGVKGRIWVSRYANPVPADAASVRDALLAAIDGLAADMHCKTEAETRSSHSTPSSSSMKNSEAAQPPASSLLSQTPEVVSVEAEWTGYRASATPQSPLPGGSERERYDEMMKACGGGGGGGEGGPKTKTTSTTTIMYMHGGAYWLMDPATHRPVVKRLAKLTGGRCYSVRYRLAPQHPFPAAILDGLVAYLTLLYPPPDAFHEAVSPKHIVFSGDSAGGNLCLALVQTILELNRQKRRVSWFGEERDLPLPAGVAVSSPWLDMTLSSPSWRTNVQWDYLPPGGRDHMDSPNRPPCAAWPASPPRRSVYIDDSLVLHPLATLLAARDWAGAPPTYICTGWELLADEDKAMAGRLAGAGVRVVLEEYEAMPHCFALVFRGRLAASDRCFDAWAGFVREVVAGPGAGRGRPSTFTTIRARTLDEVPLAPEELRPRSEEEVREELERRYRHLMQGGVGVGAALPAGAAAKL
ncbi:hypothetical protein RB598_002399 [Gaeumannomyces tritici]